MALEQLAILAMITLNPAAHGHAKLTGALPAEAKSQQLKKLPALKEEVLMGDFSVGMTSQMMSRAVRLDIYHD